jgi:proline iminopeptidase
VTELVLRGIFLLRQKELAWYYEEANGASFIFPDRWEEYVKPIPQAERGNMIDAYHRLLTGSDVAKREAAAAAWCVCLRNAHRCQH